MIWFILGFILGFGLMFLFYKKKTNELNLELKLAKNTIEWFVAKEELKNEVK